MLRPAIKPPRCVAAPIRAAGRGMMSYFIQETACRKCQNFRPNLLAAIRSIQSSGPASRDEPQKVKRYQRQKSATVHCLMGRRERRPHHRAQHHQLHVSIWET